MMLTLQQAANKLGKTRRQVLYLIQHGKLRSRKVGSHWRVHSDDLPLSPGQVQATERKQMRLANAVDDTLGLPAVRRRRYSIKDLCAFQIGAPVLGATVAALGPEHEASKSLRLTLEELARGCHRYDSRDKASAYRSARDAASRAACELALVKDVDTAPQLLDTVEQELMAALAGLLRRLERRANRSAVDRDR